MNYLYGTGRNLEDTRLIVGTSWPAIPSGYYDVLTGNGNIVRKYPQDAGTGSIFYSYVWHQTIYIPGLTTIGNGVAYNITIGILPEAKAINLTVTDTVVSDWGIVIGTILDGGALDVAGLAIDTTVQNGYITVQENGVISNTIVQSGSLIRLWGSAFDTTVESGGYLEINNKSIASGGLIQSGAEVYGLVISSGSVVVSNGSFTINNLSVQSGAIIDSMEVESGASIANYIDDNSAEHFAHIHSFFIVDQGGLAINTTVYNYELVNGEALSSTIVFGGVEDISSGGVTSNTLLISGGDQWVDIGGEAVSTIVNDFESTEFIFNSGIAISSIVEDGEQKIESGGLVVSTILSDFGEQYISNGGIASNTTINSGGYEYVSSGGSAISSFVASGGHEIIEIGGIVSGGSVASGGIIDGLVLSAGSVFVNDGAFQIYDINIQSGAILENFEIESGASITDFIENAGSDLLVDFGGSAYKTLISGGVADIYGETSGTIITDGTEHVYSGGIASNTTVNTDGFQYVDTGGTVSGTLINGGTVEFYGAAGSDQSVKFVGSGGELTLDDAANFSGIISGFSIDDTIHLSNITSVKSTIWRNGTLDISVADGARIALALPGNFQGDHFVFTDDYRGGTDIRLATPPSILDYLEASELAYDFTGGNYNDSVPIPEGFYLDAIESDASGMNAVTFVNAAMHEIIVAYRGTDFTNSTDLKIDSLGIVGGNANVINPVFTDALNVVNKLESDAEFSGYTFYVTGHSLGGAEAEAVANVLAVSTNNVSGVSFGGGDTFAAPGVSSLLSQWSVGPKDFSDTNLTDFLIQIDPLGNYTGVPAGTQMQIGSRYFLPAIPYGAGFAAGVGTDLAIDYFSTVYTRGELSKVLNGLGIDPGVAIFGLFQHSLYSYAQSLLNQGLIAVNPISKPVYAFTDLSVIFHGLSQLNTRSDNNGNVTQTGLLNVLTNHGGVNVKVQETHTVSGSTLFSMSFNSGVNTASEVLALAADGHITDTITVDGVNITAPGNVLTGLNIGADGAVIVGIASSVAGHEATLVFDANGEATISVGGDQSVAETQVAQFAAGGLAGSSLNFNTVTGSADTWTTEIGNGKEVIVDNDSEVSSINQSFNFVGANGVLTIKNPATFAGIVSAINAGDIIDLAGIGSIVEFALHAGNLLQISNRQGASFGIQFGANLDFSNSTFFMTSDGQGGSEIHLSGSVGGSQATGTHNGDHFVASGQVVSGISLTPDHYVVVESGGELISANINGGTDYVFGTANSSLVSNGGIEIVEAGGVSNGAIVGNNGSLFNDGLASDVIINSGGIDEVYGNEYKATVNSGGSEYVFGVATAIVNNGGYEAVNSGGLLNGVTLNAGGTVYVYDGGIMSDASVNSGGTLFISSGGIIRGGSVTYGGIIDGLVVASGNTVFDNNDYVLAGVQIHSGAGVGLGVGSGASIFDFVENGATLTIDNAGVTVGEVINSGGHEIVLSGGLAIDATINSGGYASVMDGGIVSGVIIQGGSVEFTGSAGANQSLIFSGSGGSLLLDTPTAFAGSVLGFGVGDTLDLTYISSVKALTWSNGVLNIAVSGGESIDIGLAGNYQGVVFEYVGNNSIFGGTEIRISGSLASFTPSFYSANYDAASGILTLEGSNLTSLSSDYTVTNFTLSGDGGVSYTLTGGSTLNGTPTGNSFAIQLSAIDQLAVDGLLNKNGAHANDGVTLYNLSAISGWDSGASAISSQIVTVGNQTRPMLAGVNYNATSGIFTFTGSHLVNHGSSFGVNLSDLSLTGGNSSFTFNSNDTISNLTADGFTVTLSSSDKETVNAFVNANGASPLSGAAYNLKAASNWDSDSGLAITTQAVTFSGVTAINVTQVLQAAGFSKPTALAVDNNGDIFLVNNSSNSIQKIAADSNTVSTLLSGFHNPITSIAVDSVGDVFAFDSYHNSVVEVSAGTAAVNTLSSSLYAPMGVGMVVDAKGDLFIAAGNAVKEIVAGTHTLTTIATGFIMPQSIAIDSAGDLFVADTGHNAIKEIQVGTHQVTTLVNGLNAPGSVAIDAENNVYFADTKNGAIEEYAASTNSVSTLASGLNLPTNLVLDKAGNLYATESNGNIAEIIHNIYVFNTPLSSGNPNVISNLMENTGQIELSASVFTALAGENSLAAENFSNAITATSPIDFIYYNENTGGIYYEACGTNGTNPIEFAVVGVNSHPGALSAADFKVNL